MPPSLPLLKALADDTRRACFEVIADAGRPLAVAEVSAAVGLHQNTVRPHLDRLCEVGLLEVSTELRGTVGRPQHRYRVREAAPSLDLSPRNYHLLSELLGTLASKLARADDAVDVGRQWAAHLAARETPDPGVPSDDAVELIRATFDHLGFDPLVEGSRVTFTHCPFRELAEAHPEIICSLHRGLCEGMVAMADGTAKLRAFHPLGSPDPCTAVLVRK
jgi:predicted ArsR family transcriptional regulator